MEQTTAEKVEDDHKGQDKLVEITVNNRPVEVPKETTGAEIKEKAGVDAEFQLFLIKGDQEIEIENDESVKVHKRMAFSATPTLDPS
ncbi:MAG: multiubiquitin domain-containing protein [Solirubrobacterales bacterium]